MIDFRNFMEYYRRIGIIFISRKNKRFYSKNLKKGDDKMYCSNCQFKFNYKNLFILHWKTFFYKKIECPNCGSEFATTPLSKLIFAVLAILPIFFLNILKLSLINVVILYPIYIVLLVAVSPLFLKIKQKNTHTCTK